MPRLLYITPGPVPPHPNEKLSRYYYLSEILEGEVLLPVWFKSADDARKELADLFPACSAGRFSIHMYLDWRLAPALRSLGRLLFFLRRGVALHRIRKFDVIAAYGTNMPGVAGAILKLLTGAKLIVEIPGAPDKIYIVAPTVRLLDRLKKRFSDLLLHVSVGAADCVYLRYPTQLSKYPLLREKPAVAFPNLVPVRNLSVETRDEKVILSMGTPWYLKGMDVLVRAFKLIAHRVPQYKLRIVGYIPDRRYLDELAQGCEQIEFVDSQADYQLGLSRIASCSVFVLASRTEAMARVLLEAMAAGKPIVASAVDGIPFYIRDNENGLLFPPEDFQALADKLLKIILDRELALRLAACARERMCAHFDERAFVRNFKRMVEIAGVSCDSDVWILPGHVGSASG
jgi:glycosyltransferase involved in cell wall biosynthesis